MPERDTLLSTLPPDVQDDAASLYDDHPSPDPRDIVAELHAKGLLDAGQLKDAVLALEASLQIRHFQKKPPTDEGDHTIIGLLGAGAMGEVLLAKDPGLNRIVAVKRLLPEASKRRSMLRRFYKEAQVTAQLDHPSIVPIHGLVNLGDDALAYAMKLVRGRTLEEYVEETKEQWDNGGGPDVHHNLSARLERFLHVCDAMAYAHERGILHRDLKPENIMVGAFGEVMVMDWGIAKVLANQEAETPEEEGEPVVPPTGTKGTKVGTVMGTPRYMSPEQSLGQTDTMDARSDQYAMGLILYELVSLLPAVPPGIGLEEALNRAENAKKQPLSHYHRKGRIPRELAAIIDKATARKPAHRYAGVEDLAEDIRRYQRDEAPIAKPDNLFQRLQRSVSRHRTAAIGLIATMALAVVVVAGMGLIGGLGAVEYRRYQAQLHEDQLTSLVARIVNRAGNTDQELARIEGLLAGVASASAQALQAPAPSLDWNPLSEEPPERRTSAYYGGKVSVLWPELATAKGVDPARHRADLTALASLGERMGDLLVRSTAKGVPRAGPERHKLIAENGVPVLVARVATRDGLMATLPGAHALREGGDPRKSDWYTSNKKKGVVWTGPHVAPHDLGLAMTASLPWFDPDGDIAGVASLDLGLDRILELIKAPKAAEAMLVDAEGRILARSGDKTGDKKKWDPEPFPRKDVWEALNANPRQGHFETGSTLALWVQLRTLDATYVVLGPSESLLRFSKDP